MATNISWKAPSIVIMVVVGAMVLVAVVASDLKESKRNPHADLTAQEMASAESLLTTFPDPRALPERDLFRLVAWADKTRHAAWLLLATPVADSIRRASQRNVAGYGEHVGRSRPRITVTRSQLADLYPELRWRSHRLNSGKEQIIGEGKHTTVYIDGPGGNPEEVSIFSEVSATNPQTAIDLSRNASILINAVAKDDAKACIIIWNKLFAELATPEQEEFSCSGLRVQIHKSTFAWVSTTIIAR